MWYDVYICYCYIKDGDDDGAGDTASSHPAENTVTRYLYGEGDGADNRLYMVMMMICHILSYHSDDIDINIDVDF